VATFLINFLKAFAPGIEAGAKTSTIRKERVDGRRPKVGDTLKLYTGLRTSGVRLLLETPATAVHGIRIDCEERHIVLDGRLLGVAEKVALAKQDGFACLEDFYGYFQEAHQGQLEGWMVEWAKRPENCGSGYCSCVECPHGRA
jgi:hypothetical protein